MTLTEVVVPPAPVIIAVAIEFSPVIFLPAVSIPTNVASVVVLIPISPVFGKVVNGLSLNVLTYPLLSFNSGLVINTEPFNDVNFALYNLKVRSCLWFSVHKPPFCDLKNEPNAYWVVYCACSSAPGSTFTTLSPCDANHTV